MSKPLILELKKQSKIVVQSNERQEIAGLENLKLGFNTVRKSGNKNILNFDEENKEIVIGENIKKIDIKAKIYVILLSVGAYAEIKITKKNNKNSEEILRKCSLLWFTRK